MIGSLLPGGVGAAEARTSATLDVLFPEERALIERWVGTRQTEFATARQCARRALADIGAPPAPILRGEQREPLWPQGVVGSITHCPGYHAAGVAYAREMISIGIDAELDEPLPEGTLELVSLPDEREQLGGTWGPHLDRLLFSAKESVYKTWFPLARRWLGFDEAIITLHDNGTFAVAVTAIGPLGTLRGRWLARDGLILTAIALPAPPSDIAG